MANRQLHECSFIQVCLWSIHVWSGTWALCMSMESRYASAGIASWVTSLQQPPFSTSNTAKIHGAAEHMYCANRTVRVIMRHRLRLCAQAIGRGWLLQSERGSALTGWKMERQSEIRQTPAASRQHKLLRRCTADATWRTYWTIAIHEQKANLLRFKHE